MADHDIEIRYQHGKFDYFEKGVSIGENHKVRNHQTISWISHDGDIDIDFTGHGCDPTGNGRIRKGKDHSTGNIQLTRGATGQCKYDVSVNGHKDPFDPIIIFDDRDEDDEDETRKVEAVDSKALRASAPDTFQQVVDRLTGIAKTKGDPERLFFPQGIELISITIPVFAATVKVQVAGPKYPLVEKTAEVVHTLPPGAEAADLKSLGDSAADVLQQVVVALSKVVNEKGVSPRLFFPNGINLISVEVDVGSDLLASVKVGGPGVSALEKTKQE